jgi:hypothetical protein
VAVADFNRDGHRDLVTANFMANSVTILIGSAAELGPATAYPSGDQPVAVAFGDLDLDGHQDLAIANYGDNTISVRLGDGAGGFGAATHIATGTNPYSVAIADLDGDGKLDLVEPNYSDQTVSVMLGDGTGHFGPRTDFATGSGPVTVAAGDLNGDGLPDLAVANSTSGSVSVLLATGAGAFAPRTDYPAGAGATTVAIADLNADGKPDLVVANYFSNSVSVLLGTGGGNFGAATDVPTGSHAVSLAAGDLNGDGRLDLAVVNQGANSISLLPGDGAGGFGAASTLAMGPGTAPRAAIIGDFNGDGRPDLGVANFSANDVSILLGDGSGGFGGRIDYPAGGGSYAVAAADLNGDGRLDVAIAAFRANTVSIFPGLAPTLTSLSSSRNPCLHSDSLTLTASVTIAPPGSGAATGTVAFFDGTTPLGSASVVSGIATLTVATPALGPRPLSAAYSGDGGRQPSLSMALAQRVAASGAPTIESLIDVPNDQGGALRLRFHASPLDFPGPGTTIVRYDLLRRDDSAPRAAGARPAAGPPGNWITVGSVASAHESVYVAQVATAADSNAAGPHRAAFIVRAVSVPPAVSYDSAADSASSIDNLAPATPTGFTGAFVSGATHLHWLPNTEPDLAGYRVDRGGSADFVPSPATLLATPSDTGYADVGPGGAYYKLSALDRNGNSSGYASLGPENTLSADPYALVFALNPVRPNPGPGDRLGIEFVLPRAGPARLELLDASGRRLAVREVGGLGPGRHVVDVAEGHRLAPGLYVVRLSQAGAVRVRRAAVLR